MIWDVKVAAMPYIEGFYVRYRDMSGGSEKFNIKTVLNNQQHKVDFLEGSVLGGSDSSQELTVTSSHVITSLKKFTEYEVFLMPFFQQLEGQPSNRSGHLLNFFLFPFCKRSLIRLEGKSMTPHRGNPIFSSVPPSNSLVSVSNPRRAF